MNQSFSEQLAGFYFSLGVGVLLGAFYDVFRVLRSMLGSKKSHVFFQDLLYMCVSAVITFLSALAYSNGRVRFYLLIGEIAGWFVWHFTVGRVTVGVCRFIFRMIRRCITEPIRTFLVKWLVKMKKVVRKGMAKRKKIHRNSEKNLKPYRKLLYNLSITKCFHKRRAHARKDGPGT